MSCARRGGAARTRHTVVATDPAVAARRRAASVFLTVAPVGDTAAAIGDFASLEPATAKGIELGAVVSAKRVPDGVVHEDIETLHHAIGIATVDPMRVQI